MNRTEIHLINDNISTRLAAIMAGKRKNVL